MYVPTPATAPIRVLIVDDYRTVLWGMARLIQGEWPRLELVGVAANRTEALLAARHARPHIVLLDSVLDNANGLGLIPELNSVGGMRVIVLSAAPDAELQRRARTMGAYSALGKTAPAELLLRTIDSVHRFGRWFDAQATEPPSIGSREVGRSGP
jgi:DNA-binding NarL/FixJ family response regulator